jgi:hypothetical protein
MSKIHIGKKIREVVDRSHFSIVEFAKRINLSRDGAYKIFAKEYIDTDQLKQISKVLKHDFFNYYSLDLIELKDPKDKFGFATRDELTQSNREIITFIKGEFSKLREELSLKEESYKIKRKPRKK